jgi:hypothetical protein
MHGSDVKFYKYLSPTATIATLENKTLKWTCPKLFNDPFDLPCEVDFSFSPSELAVAFIEEQVRLVYDIEEPIGDMSHDLFKILIHTRNNKNKTSKELFRKSIQQGSSDIETGLSNGIEKLRACYRSFRENFSILCVSKVYDNLLMWAHYTEKHTGCVLKLRCFPEMDRPLCMAQKVVYQSTYPLIANLEDYVKHLTGQIKLDYDKIFKTFILTKSKEWEYEQEWRCIWVLKDKKSGFDFDPMVPEELEGVYFGCNIDNNTEKRIVQLIQESYPLTKIYKARTDIQNYKLLFDQIL